jgi:RHH-type transcriptional regulator, proline utilization regulon repressor / proline dehydrogenase / delta 1-pyrroline-5-carboxylate dehydrogenase
MNSVSPSPSRSGLRALTRAPEPEVLAGLVDAARLTPAERDRAVIIGKQLLASVRAADRQGWVEKFLQQYRLDTDEGVALLSLAEAYLRVPDAGTAEALIRDKLGGADWKAHMAKSDSLLVNSATFGLLLTQAVMGEDQPQAGVLRRLIARTSEPFVRTAVAAAMRIMGEQFVLGRTIDEALSEARSKDNRAFRYSFDMLGEAARTHADAERYYESYIAAVDAVGKKADAKEPILARNSVSVKLSALHPRYEEAHAATCLSPLFDKILHLAERAKAAGIGLTIDAEETDRLELSLDLIERIAAAPSLKDWDGLGMAVQGYQKRARAMIDWCEALGAATQRRLTVRLVKGAYWDSEIKRCQERGLTDYPVFTRKPATDVSYLACAKAMLAAPHIYPAFASHNALTVASIAAWAGERRDFEFQRLHGMGVGLYEDLIEEQGFACRVYAPVGGHRDLLAYLVRRLLENGANSSFVHQMADASVPADALLKDPVADVEAKGLRAHAHIPRPAHLYGSARTNSAGYDPADRDAMRGLLAAIVAVPAVAPPADMAASDVAGAVGRADAAFPAWEATPVTERAACLERAADLLRTHDVALFALLTREAKKTIPDAIAEIREAEDFCRYYAVEARKGFAETALPGPTGEANSLRLAGRGVFACIAPWNFPLAIFLGQVAAALVAGNTVVAKPAPQTPAIAALAVDLLHQAGIPKDAVILAPGGPPVGAALTGDARVMGVAFTGSTATAKRIAATLLDDPRRPIVPLIAETGGLNTMIVDSTALPEQVVADVVTSAFQSAGQRCSALRLLVVQEDVADKIIAMLKGAMETLVVGSPGDLATDVPPVIDIAAQSKILAHLDAHRARVLHQCAAPAGDSFVPPTLIQLGAVSDLREEIFGPVLHVVTWKAGTLDGVIDAINASGYGLTLGVHSRLSSVVDQVRARARVGNLYVNRSMIGAVVGVQPFGGEGLSGTGPKAGGPHYLHRFATERTVSIDTTSAGGNATLLSLED